MHLDPARRRHPGLRGPFHTEEDTGLCGDHPGDGRVVSVCRRRHPVARVRIDDDRGRDALSYWDRGDDVRFELRVDL